MRPTLKRGDKGPEVKQLQAALNGAGATIDVDGIFGTNTEAAVKALQKAKGLSIDGVVTVGVWNSLNWL